MISIPLSSPTTVSSRAISGPIQIHKGEMDALNLTLRTHKTSNWILGLLLELPHPNKTRKPPQLWLLVEAIETSLSFLAPSISNKSTFWVVESKSHLEHSLQGCFRNTVFSFLVSVLYTGRHSRRSLERILSASLLYSHNFFDNHITYLLLYSKVS